MAKIERFEDIEAWKLARDSTKLTYEISSTGDFSRDFGLRDQIRRSSVSVMSNMPRDLKEMETENSSSSWRSQKVRVARLVPNFMSLWIRDT